MPAESPGDWRWYQDRPKPHQVSLKINAIPVTTLAKDLKFPPLTVYFSESAARLEDLKKKSLTGIRLEPQIAGDWHWANDSTLLFEPTEDWPADQKYRIVFDKKFFPPHVVMERLAYDVQTPPFAIAIKDLTFYQDPANPTLRQVTATLELTHAVEKGELEKHLQIAVTGGSAIFPCVRSGAAFHLGLRAASTAGLPAHFGHYVARAGRFSATAVEQRSADDPGRRANAEMRSNQKFRSHRSRPLSKLIPSPERSRAIRTTSRNNFWF